MSKMSEKKLLNVGCGTHYADGWLNIDVWEDATIKPDMVVPSTLPYPFDDNTFDAVYMGHVLEHIPWNDVIPVLRDISRIAKPGAPILVVGPDVFRTLGMWINNQVPLDLVHAVLEHQDIRLPPTAKEDKSITELQSAETWTGAPHHWNCHEDRTLSVMRHAFVDCVSYSDTIPFDQEAVTFNDPATGIIWPVTHYTPWQFAVMGYAV